MDIVKQFCVNKTVVVMGSMYPTNTEIQANLGATSNRWNTLWCDQINNTPINSGIGSVELIIKPVRYLDSSLLGDYGNAFTRGTTGCQSGFVPVDWTQIMTDLNSDTGASGATFLQVQPSTTVGLRHLATNIPGYNGRWGIEVTATGTYQFDLFVNAYILSYANERRLFQLVGITGQTASYSSGATYLVEGPWFYQQRYEPNAIHYSTNKYINSVPQFFYIEERGKPGWNDGVKYLNLSFSCSAISKIV